MSQSKNVSRIPAPISVGNLEASMGDLPKQGSDPKQNLRDAGTIAQALAIIYAECDRQNEASNAARQEGGSADMYRHNTALHALWHVAEQISALSEDGAMPDTERSGA